ncbi:sterol desaturase family protein [Candidatus Gracilibacteria bacterium]|nr:sterol desaturase family protein [Candidatus Gracilibacteria bacterium]
MSNSLIFIINNLLFLGFSLGSVSLLVADYKMHNTFSIVPDWLQFIVGFLILDIMIYTWHVFSHRVDFLWRFHKAHHSEKYLNTTSSVRFHIGELLISVLFKVVILIVFGIPLWVFVIHEALITLFAAFHHSNIKLSPKIQNIFEKIIITPDLHKTHHSTLRAEHDNNYGVIFSWWDIIFKTKSKAIPKEIGLALPKELGGEVIEEKTFRKFLLFPFKTK